MWQSVLVGEKLSIINPLLLLDPDSVFCKNVSIWRKSDPLLFNAQYIVGSQYIFANKAMNEM